MDCHTRITTLLLLPNLPKRGSFLFVPTKYQPKNNVAIRKFAQNIRKLRADKFTQADLGFASQIHPVYIGRIERAEINPPLTSVLKIAFALDCSLQDLFQGIEEGDVFSDENKTKKLPRLRK